jgi:PAS domain S-box-containing protein
VYQVELEMQNEELRAAQVSLEESRDLYIDLYNHAPVGYLLLNSNGLISEINLTAIELLGMDRSKFLNHRFASFVTTEYSDRWHLFFSNAINGNKRQTIEIVLKHFNGTEVPVQLDCIQVVPVAHNSMLRITMTDIHKIKDTEHRLRDKTFLLAESQAIAHIGSWSINLTTACVIWSDEMYRIYGVNKETFQPTVKGFIELIHPDDRKLMQKRVDNYFAKIEPIEQDFRIILPDGSVRTIRSKGGLQYDRNKIPILMIGTVNDITDRVKLELLTKQHLIELAHVTRLGLLGEMASGIAHEVNQPLTAIAAYAQVNVNLITRENPDLVKLADISNRIQEQAVRAGQIIHRMKRFCLSKIQQRSASDINELINECVNLCADSLRQNSVKLKLELESNLPLISVDHIQIEQVIINLIRNANDAILSLPNEKQGQISIQTRFYPNKEMEVRIKDNGPGIREDHKVKIFMPFHTTKEEGMGMGLSISRSLIEAHNGKLYFNSQFGKGTTFYFTLPCIS